MLRPAAANSGLGCWSACVCDSVSAMADHLVDGPPSAKRQKLDPFQGPSDSSGELFLGLFSCHFPIARLVAVWFCERPVVRSGAPFGPLRLLFVYYTFLLRLCLLSFGPCESVQIRPEIFGFNKGLFMLGKFDGGRPI